MRKIFIAIVSAAFTMAVMTSLQACQKDETPGGFPETETVTCSADLSYYGVRLTGETSWDTRYGHSRYFEMDTVAQPTTRYYSGSTGMNRFDSDLIEYPVANRTYYCRAVVAKDGDTLRSPVISFFAVVGEAKVSVDTLRMTPGTTQDAPVVVSSQFLKDSLRNWTSDNTSVATVDSKGVITAVAEGRATVRADFIYGSYVTVNVCVTATALDIMNVYATPSTCEVSCSFFSSENVTEKGVCWCDEDRDATVDDTKVTAGTGTGDFTAVITGLKEHSKYWFRPYCITDGEVTYGKRNFFVTAKESWAYLDEYGVTWYGVAIEGSVESLGGQGSYQFVWAPVPCGYKAVDADGRGYPYGKLYQMGRPAGQGRGEAVWNDPSDHTKGGHFTDENGTTVELVYGQCAGDKLGESDKFYFNDTPYYITPLDNEVTEQEKQSVWKTYEHTYDWTDFDDYTDEDNGHLIFRNPCPEGWNPITPSTLNSSLEDKTDGCYTVRDGRMIWTGSNTFEKSAQGIWFDLTEGGYRGADGEYHSIRKDESYSLLYTDWMDLRTEFEGDNPLGNEHYAQYRMTPTGPEYVKTFNNATAATVRCVKTEWLIKN